MLDIFGQGIDQLHEVPQQRVVNNIPALHILISTQKSKA
jgi:hypothetical protein